MFGEKIDIHILRLISHDRNIKTEEELEAEIELFNHNATEEDFKKFTGRSGQYFDWHGKKILDVCCGKGDLVRSLAKNGAKEVLGVDIQHKHIEIAKKISEKENIQNVKFIESDFHKFYTDARFDYVISYEAFDHIHDMRGTLKKMANLLKNNGEMVNFAAGFWGSPSADHCDNFMRIFIPWRHLIFNEKALFKIRQEKFRPTDLGTNFESIRGGLSKYTFTDYKKAIHELEDFEIVTFECNYQFKYIFNGLFYPLYLISQFVSRIPLLKELFIYSSFTVLKKTADVALDDKYLI